MKGYHLLMFLVGLTLWNNMAFGQAQQTKAAFPSYDQIKSSKDATVNYGGSSNVLKTERKVIKLFDYPAGTVTYILNGKASTDMNYVKQVVSDKEKDIEFISIGKPDEQGKRVIKIDYTLP